MRWRNSGDSERRIREELDAELEFHFARTIEDLVEQGMPREAAEVEARKRFGDERRYRRELAEIDRRHAVRLLNLVHLDGLALTIVSAFRSIRRSPSFASGIILTFGIGIGANATMFGVVDRLLIQPPSHVSEHESVGRVYVNTTMFGSPLTTDYLSLPDYRDLTNSQSLADIAAYSPEEMTLGSGESARSVRTTIATASLFPLLGVQPALGRFFTHSEDQPGSAGVVVLGHEFWSRQFGADPNAIGTTLEIGIGSYTVIGVAPEGFTGAELAPVDLWLPLHVAADRMYDGDSWLNSRQWWFFKAVARRRDAVETPAGEAELTTLYRAARADHSHSDPHATITLASLVAARAPDAAAETVVTRWLAGVSLLVLLIVCANVMNLMLARGLRWKREIALRIALGISNARLFGQLLAEVLVLAVLGGTVALLVAFWGADIMRTTLVPDVLWGQSPVNVRLFAFTLAVSLAVGIVAGIAPAIQANRQEIDGALKEDGRRNSLRRSRSQTALLLSQGALAVVLLVGAGLFVKSLHHFRTLDHGMNVQGVLVAGIELNSASTELSDAVDVYSRAVRNVRSLPGVAQASAVSVIPFQGTRSVFLSVPGMDSLPGGPEPPHAHGVMAEYFSTLGMPISVGRDFTETDAGHIQRVAIINEKMAGLYWPFENALGKCLKIGPDDPPCAEIIGVVPDARERNATADPGPQFYALMEQGVDIGAPRAILVRGAANVDGMTEAVRSSIVAADPSIRAVNIMDLSDLVDPQMRSWKLGATMFTVFGALALVVAAIGLHSVLAFDIASRTHELGIRSALGASTKKLVTLVFRQALGLTAVAVALGIMISIAAGNAVESMLFEVSPRDPLIIALVTAALLLVAVVAGVAPARRASRVEPMEALRSE
jgi:predicted permease